MRVPLREAVLVTVLLGTGEYQVLTDSLLDGGWALRLASALVLVLACMPLLASQSSRSRLHARAGGGDAAREGRA